MKKIILAVLAFLFISATAYLVYLSRVILPEKIRFEIVDALSCATDKTVTLAGARLDIFRGLVLKDLVISDKDSNILVSKDASCTFLILPLLNKQIVITGIRFESPEIFLERFPDNSINIIEAFFKKPILLMKNECSLTISRVIVSKGTVHFKDGALSPPFMKEIKNLSFDARFSLPDKVRYDAEFELPSKITSSVKSSGEYNLRTKELSLDVEAHDFYPKEFEPYLQDLKMALPEGRIDSSAKIYFKEGRLDADITLTSLGLVFSQDKINADLNCALRARAKYDLDKKELIYSGKLDIKNLSLSGLDYIGRIDDIRGEAEFGESMLSSKNLTCTVLGVPVRAAIELSNPADMSLKINASCDVGLAALQSILKNNFLMDIPAEMSGAGALDLALQYKLPVTADPVIKGSLVTSDAVLKLEHLKMPLEEAAGRINFSNNQLAWQEVDFKYMGEDYETSGLLTNFDKPGVELKLSSDRLDLESLFAVNGKVVALSKFKGRFDDSEFSVQGDIDTKDPSDITANISGSLRFNIDPANEMFRKFSGIIKDSKAAGAMRANFNLKGRLNNLDNALINAEVTGETLSVCGLKLNDFRMEYVQANGIMNIARIQSSLYGGTLDARGTIDLVSKEMPYEFSADIKNLKLEKIKKDTAFKNMDIAGSVRLHGGGKGSSDGAAKLNAWGKINISDGKLWQLNLFKGMGTLLFKSDFNSVIFREASCDFVVRNKFAYINDLVMKSDLLDIYGVARVGFDNSINASLKAEFTDEGIDAGNMADAAGAIERYTIMEISGTLKEPKYRVRPDLTNVVSDIAESFFRR